MSQKSLKLARVPHWRYIFLTVVIATLLTVIPLPDDVQLYWPDWITLVVFYWVLVLPLHLGVTFGWVLGLVEDVVSFSLLGEHALAKSLVGTIAALTSRRFAVFNFIERLVIVFIAQSSVIAVNATINNFALGTPINLMLWQPAITTCLIWPAFSLALDQFDPNN